MTEFLKNEEFHHKASKNTDAASNGKSTTDIISLTLGGLRHTQRSDNSKRHPQNDTFRSDSSGTDVVKAPLTRKAQTMGKTLPSNLTR